MLQDLQTGNNLTLGINRGRCFQEAFSCLTSSPEIVVVGVGSGEPLDLTLAIEVQYLLGRNKKYENVNLGNVVYCSNRKPQRVYRVYKNRFAIEPAYCIRNIVIAETSSRNVGIGC